MRHKATLAVIVGCGLMFGLGASYRSQNAENKDKIFENITKTEEIDIDSDDSAEETGRCYGEALNVSDRDGKIPIYIEANRSSGTVEVLSDYDSVEVLEVVPYGWFKVKLQDGREGYAESKMVRVEKLPDSNYEIREEGYTIHYSESDQMLTLYKDAEIVFKSKGSSGIDEEFTPKGVFKVDKDLGGEKAYASEFGQGYNYYTSFYEAAYLIHSVPFAEDGYVIPEENRKLGQPASHGCIRVPIPVAKYIYDNVPGDTLVIIE